MTLTHSQNTDWADSTTDTPRANGLTALGRRIVRQMAQMGMAIDVSHAADKTIAHVLKATPVPIMASHSNARKTLRHPAQPDRRFHPRHRRPPGLHRGQFFPGLRPRRVFDQIEENFKKYEKEIQDRTRGHLDDPDFLSQVEWEYYVRAAAGTDPVALDEVIDHIVHIAATGGIDCVGLGSDFDGIPSTPQGLGNVAAFRPWLPPCKNGASGKGRSARSAA